MTPETILQPIECQLVVQGSCITVEAKNPVTSDIKNFLDLFNVQLSERSTFIDSRGKSIDVVLPITEESRAQIESALCTQGTRFFSLEYTE
jgi:hypothetical protein